jgi:hypothetical protein
LKIKTFISKIARELKIKLFNKEALTIKYNQRINNRYEHYVYFGKVYIGKKVTKEKININDFMESLINDKYISEDFKNEIRKSMIWQNN